MGNCIKPVDPFSSALRSINIDTSPIIESQLPIIFLIGGPGAGKRTLCNKVAEKYGFLCILSTDVIRTEVSTRTDRAFVLARLMSQGRLVPTDILIELITMKMLDHLKDTKGFIVSGFPKHKKQCEVFDREVRPPDLVLYLNVRNSVMSDRIMAKSIITTERLSSGFDDIKKQIKEFRKTNRSMIKYYQELLVVIDGEYDVMTVYENTCKIIDDLLENLPNTSLAVVSADDVEKATDNSVTSSKDGPVFTYSTGN